MQVRGPLKGVCPLKPTFFTPDVTLHEISAASSTISYVGLSAPARSAEASAEGGLLSCCLARPVDTRRHRSTLPLCSHTTPTGATRMVIAKVIALMAT